MNPTLCTYACYLVISVALTVWVARTLFRNGRVFLVDVFGREELADSVNHLLVVGFYLINFGFVSLALKLSMHVKDATESVEALSYKIGYVLVVLGAMHFVNLYVFSRIRRNKGLATAPRPVPPDPVLPEPLPPEPFPTRSRSRGRVMAAADDRDLQLTVYFDADCGLCRRVAHWLEGQPKFVPLHCVAAQSPGAGVTCPVTPAQLLAELTVTASDGCVYRGTKAWIMCLWALRSYRGWAMSLSSEAMWPLAGRLFAMITTVAGWTKTRAVGS